MPFLASWGHGPWPPGPRETVAGGYAPGRRYSHIQGPAPRTHALARPPRRRQTDPVPGAQEGTERHGEGELALVMSGGGARAAYQIGFLRTIARLRPALSFPILTGVSAGAINAAYLAAGSGPLPSELDRLAELWKNLETSRVFRTGALGLFGHVARWGMGLLSGGRLRPELRGMVDTAPLRALLHELFAPAADGSIPGIAENLRRGALRALAITTSSYSTGQSITWVEGRQIRLWERAHRRSRQGRIGIAHVMASGALPFLFPAEQIGAAYYGDGGMRLTAPFSPAVHLGARRILAISTRYARTSEEADESVVAGYPPPAQVAGVLLNAIFLDLFDGDALRLERINELVRLVPPERREGLGLRELKLLVMRPSRDLGKLANEYEARLPRTFRFLTRGFGTRETRSNDVLSLVMFQPDYLARLIELGERDAEQGWARIEAFLGDEGRAPLVAAPEGASAPQG